MLEFTLALLVVMLMCRASGTRNMACCQRLDRASKCLNRSPCRVAASHRMCKALLIDRSRAFGLLSDNFRISKPRRFPSTARCSGGSDKPGTKSVWLLLCSVSIVDQVAQVEIPRSKGFEKETRIASSREGCCERGR